MDISFLDDKYENLDLTGNVKADTEICRAKPPADRFCMSVGACLFEGFLHDIFKIG